MSQCKFRFAFHSFGVWKIDKMYFIQKVFWAFVLIRLANALIIEEEKTSIREMGEFFGGLIDFADEHTSGTLDLLFINMNGSSDVSFIISTIKKATKGYHNSVQLSTPIDYSMQQVFGIIFVFLDSKQISKNHLKEYTLCEYFNRAAKIIFIIYYDTKSPISQAQLGELANLGNSVSKMGINDFLIITNKMFVYKNISRDYSIYRMFATNIYNFEFVMISNSSNIEGLFEKVPLSGFELRLLQYNIPPKTVLRNGRMYGTEGKFLDAFCDYHKVNYSIIDLTSKPTVREIFNGFLNRKIDMSLSSEFEIQSSQFIFKIEYLNEIDGVCIIVPRSKPVSQFSSLLRPFDKWTWGILLITTLLMIPIWKVFSNYFGSRFTYNFIILNIFRYLLNAGPTGERRMNYREKSVVYFYLLLTFILMTTYQSLLISYMLTPKYADFFRTFEEFNNSDMKIYIFPKDLNIHFNVPATKIINMTSLKDDIISPFILPRIINKSLAYLNLCNYADLFLKSDRNFENNKPLFSRIDEKLTTFRLSNMYNVNSPFLDKIKPFADRVFESGLKQIWKFEVDRDDVGEFFAFTVNEKIYLDFEDFKVPFSVLLYGLSSSLIVFLAELLRKWIDSWKK